MAELEWSESPASEYLPTESRMCLLHQLEYPVPPCHPHFRSQSPNAVYWLMRTDPMKGKGEGKMLRSIHTYGWTLCKTALGPFRSTHEAEATSNNAETLVVSFTSYSCLGYCIAQTTSGLPSYWRLSPVCHSLLVTARSGDSCLQSTSGPPRCSPRPTLDSPLRHLCAP